MTVEGDYQIGVFWKQAVSGKVYLGKGNVLQARREVTTISQTPPAQVSGTLSTGPLDLFVEVWD